MIRYQLLIEYVGTNFRGWQIQKKGSTIQGLIQEKLTKLLKQKIILNGSGRTDTGVHAIEQSAHFYCKNEIKDLTKFLKSINFFLNDKGIAIKKIKKSLNSVYFVGNIVSIERYRSIQDFKKLCAANDISFSFFMKCSPVVFLKLLLNGFLPLDVRFFNISNFYITFVKQSFDSFIIEITSYYDF